MVAYIATTRDLTGRAEDRRGKKESGLTFPPSRCRMLSSGTPGPDSCGRTGCALKSGTPAVKKNGEPWRDGHKLGAPVA